MTPEEYFELLAVAAMSDGVLQDEEEPILLAYAKALGLSGQVARRLLARAGSDQHPPLPKDPEVASQLFEDLVRVLAADGLIADSERELLEHVAPQLGIDPEQLEAALRDALEE